MQIHESVSVESSAQIGVPYRPLLDGEKWDRLGRSISIGANCAIGHFCVVGEEVVMGRECILDAYSKVSGGATLGERVLVVHRADVGEKAIVGDDCVIAGVVGERCRVGKRCRVFGSLVHRQLNPDASWDAADSQEVSAVLEDDVFIGWGATVIGGITIGQRAYVCAGALVSKDVPPRPIVKGVNEIVAPEEWSGSLKEVREIQQQFPSQ